MEPGKIVSALISMLGEKQVIWDREQLYPYAMDYCTGNLIHPLAVVKPVDVNGVSNVVRFCNQIGQKITTRAGGSSVSGGATSHENGIILSVEGLSSILEINEIDGFVIAESGVITQDLQNRLEEKGLWFPQNISSASMSCIGGNVAVSSGSPKSLKYGTTKNSVLNLEVVLPNGDVIWTGKNVRKNATGYNLTQLFVGSEGTLGIITKVVLEIRPLLKEALLMVPFDNENSLFQFVKCFFERNYCASSLEFLDRNACVLMSNYTNKEIDFGEEMGGIIWIELESKNDEENLEKAEHLYHLIDEFSDFEVFLAQTKQDIASLWDFRKRIGKAALSYSNFTDLDVVVPRSTIETMYANIKKICTSQNLEFIVIGHIGDGNFHINIFRPKSLDDRQWENTISDCSQAIFKTAIDLGGEISGEHGIGKIHCDSFLSFSDPNRYDLMRRIKLALDPNLILNPNTIFDEGPLINKMRRKTIQA